MGSYSNCIRNYTNKEYKVQRLFKGTEWDDYFPETSIDYVGRHRKHRRRSITEVLISIYTIKLDDGRVYSYPQHTWQRGRYNQFTRHEGDRRLDYRCWKRYRKHQYKE